MAGTQKPTWFFPAHVYVCAIQDQGFFLDLKRNEYLSAPLCELQSLSRSVDGWPRDFNAVDPQGKETSSQSAIDELARNHILSAKPLRLNKLEAPPGPPARGALRNYGSFEYSHIFFFHLFTFLKAAILARYFLSVRSLYAMMRRIERRRLRESAARGSGDLATMRRLVEVFMRLQPLLPPTQTPCLVNSITLLEFLATYGQFPRLVFGVQSHPFCAHCWIQHGDVVLNSALEQVRQFTPMNGRRQA